MFAPHHLKIVDGIGRFRPQGRTVLVDAVDLITGALGFCRQNGIAKLLVNLRHLDGVAVPSTVDRFLMVTDWADAAQGAVTMALVVLPQYIDPQRFGMQVAADAGLSARVFTSEGSAEDWLRTVR